MSNTKKKLCKKVHDKEGVKIHVRRSENSELCTLLKSVLSFHKAHNFPKLILCQQQYISQKQVARNCFCLDTLARMDMGIS